MTTTTEPEPITSEAAGISTLRSATSLRALGVGSLLALGVAVVTPINSLALGNSMLFGSYLPPVAVVLAAVLVLGVNPLLGRHRLVRGELITILILMICLGGVVGQGLVRSLPGFMVGPASTLPHLPSESQLMVAVEDDPALVRRSAERVVAIFDADGDGMLNGSELHALGPCLDPSPAGVDVAAVSAVLTPPAQRYVFPTGLAVGVPDRGRVEAGHPAHRHLVRGYQDGLDSVHEVGRVGYGDRLTLRSESGDQRQWWVFSGPDRERALLAGHGVADPGASPEARSLLNAKTGTTVGYAGSRWELVAIDAAGVPWGRWWQALLLWSPLLLGAMLAMVAIAGIVRHQWLVGERLAFPIARVFTSLTDDHRSGVWRQQGLWVAAAVVVAIQAWRSAHAAGWMPIDFTLSLDLYNVVPRDTWIGKAPMLWPMTQWHLWFTVVAMTFLITPEVGFSLWGTFIGVNVACALLITGGMEITQVDLQSSAIGGAGVLAAVLIWVGRLHYLAVLKAAIGLGAGGHPAARAAAPYVWLLLLGCGAMLGFMLLSGIPLGAGIFVIAALLLTTVVLARCVAESGVPYASLAHHGRVGELCMLWIGPAVPIAGLLPLAMLGYLFGGGDRERLLGHALNAHAMDDAAGDAKPHRSSVLILWSAVLGIGGAFVGMLVAGYYFGGAVAGDGFAQAVWGAANHRIGMQLDASNSESIDLRRGRALWAYAAGAVVVLVISFGRLRIARWPLHPIGFILMTGWVSTVCWFSFAVGWLLKVMVLRYGGQRLYQRLFPVAIGLVLGDALSIVAVMILRGSAQALGYEFPDVTILPK